MAAPATTRADIERRRLAVPLGVIPYSQGRISAVTGRRSDCSGLISYVWALPKTGPGTYLNAYSTGTLSTQRLIIEVPRSQLRKGDAVGYCAPDSPGNGGHIALYLGRSGDRIHVWDHGSGLGPKDRWVTWNAGSTGWLAPSKGKGWRYVGVVEPDGTTYSPDGPPIEEEFMDTVLWQELLIEAGHDIGSTGADGQFGPKTRAASVAALLPLPASSGGVSEDRARALAREEIAATALHPQA